MILTDFCTLTCMALTTEGPTRAPSAVQRMWQMPLAMLTVDPGDGTNREHLVGEVHFPTMKDDLDPLLEEYVGKLSALHHGAIDNLIGIFTTVFTRFTTRRDFHRYDRLHMEQAGDRLAVHLEFHGPRYGVQNDGWPGEGEDAHRVCFSFGDLSVFDPRAVITTRTLHSDALNAFAALTRAPAAEAVE